MIRAFPPEDVISEDNYLASPVSIAGIGDTLFVADVKRDEIIRYRTNGEYLGAMGRAGDGPGEFRELNAVVTDFSGAGLWVHSHAGMKPQHLTRDSQYLGGFYPPYPAYGFAPLTDSTLVLVCDPNAEHGSLVCVTNAGEPVWSTSPILEVEGTAGFVPLTNSSAVAVLNGDIWQIYEHFNIIRIFSPVGVLLRERTFTDELIILAHEENIADHLLLATGVTRRNDRQVSPTRIFAKPRVAGGYLWIQAYLHLFQLEEPLARHCIVQINRAGEVVARYFTEEEEPLFIIDVLPLSTRPHTSMMLLTAGHRHSVPQVIHCREGDP